MEIIQTQRNWVMEQLKPRNIEEHLFTCEQCFKRYHIVTVNEKWVRYDTPQEQKIKKIYQPYLNFDDQNKYFKRIIGDHYRTHLT